jgi:hypothetical protein
LTGADGAVGPQGPQGLTGADGPVGPQGPQGPAGADGAVGPQGAQGPAGADGAVGPQGPQGLTGADGAVGPQGPQGPQGPAGADGAVGPQGLTGADGAVGPQGPQGLTGADGAVGPQGPQGPQGPAGADGAVGPQGPQGLTGADGAVGPQGPQGPAGVDGAVGPQGPQGLTGADGAVGPQGPQGLTGADGAVGPQGPQGLTGADGAIGPQGPQGPAGVDGADGAIGPQGPQGPAGADGAVGPQGPIGLTGPQGPQGNTGATGAVGPQGAQGPIGLTGPQGPQGNTGATGAVGPQGAQGPIGLTGPQGPQGNTGATGAIGPQGPAGPVGCGVANFVVKSNGSSAVCSNIFDNGTNVGISTTSPAYRLDLANGTFGFGNSNQRTETRNDAGIQGNAGAQSGFFETSSPVNYPAGASSWWHLIDVRHSNTGNNYALQIAGSFFDQNLYFRKTNSNGATAWSQLLTTASANTGYIQNQYAGAQTANHWISGNSRANEVYTNNWFRNITSGTGLYNEANATGIYSPSAGVMAIYNNGNLGVGITAPTAKLHVEADADNLPVIYGRNTNASAGTSSYGVRGESGATGLGSAGVYGYSVNSGQNEIGTLGDYSLWGTGVFGLGWASAFSNMPASRDFGVFGTATFSTGTGVGAYDGSNSGASQALYAWGRTVATGAKSASVPTSQGNQLVYCMESPEIWFEEVGSATLVNGQVRVELDPMFLETVFIDAEHPLEVFVQEQGESEGLYVVPDLTGFVVKEKRNGMSNIRFSFRVLAKRRNYQDHRFGVDGMQPLGNNLQNAKYVEPITTDVDVMRQLLEKAKADKEAQKSGAK